MNRGNLVYRCLRCEAEYARHDVPDLTVALASLATIGRVPEMVGIGKLDIHACGEGRSGVAYLIGGDASS